MDWRFSALKFFKEKKEAISALAAFFISVAVVISYALDDPRSGPICQPDCKIWLSVLGGRLVASSLLLALLTCIDRYELNFLGSSSCYSRFRELIEVFGLVWFTVGNFLLFNANKECISHERTCFFASLTYIAGVYFWLLVPFFIRLMVFTQPENNNFNAVVTRNVDERQLQLRSLSPSSQYGMSTSSWLSWLKNHGSEPFHYVPSSSSGGDHLTLFDSKTDGIEFCSCAVCLCLLDEEPTADADVECACAAAGSMGSGSVLGSTAINGGAVVENAAESSDDVESAPRRSPERPPPERPLVIAFPCHGKHLFHVPCLTKWLQICSTKGAEFITCPCCRERATSASIRTRASSSNGFSRLGQQELDPGTTRFGLAMETLQLMESGGEVEVEQGERGPDTRDEEQPASPQTDITAHSDVELGHSGTTATASVSTPAI